MHSTIKVIDRNNNLRTLGDSLELKNAAEQKASNIVEVDLSTNELDNLEALDVFPNLKILMLDKNRVSNLNSLPVLSSLETLSLTYNGLRDLTQCLVNLTSKCPKLRNLNVMKNPMNPMFDSEERYAEFRATVRVWLPNLQYLDGTDFKDVDQSEAMKKNKRDIEEKRNQALKQAGSSAALKRPLESIPEEGKQSASKLGASSGKKNVAEEDILKDLKKNKGAAGAGGSTYQFNQRAYKKYHSTRSLVERILKSHSEGNRFIRNEDL